MKIVSVGRLDRTDAELYLERVSPAIILVSPDALSTDGNRNASLDRGVSYAGFDNQGNEWLIRATEQYPVTVVSAVSRRFNKPVTLMVKNGRYDHWVSNAVSYGHSSEQKPLNVSPSEPPVTVLFGEGSFSNAQHQINDLNSGGELADLFLNLWGDGRPENLDRMVQLFGPNLKRDALIVQANYDQTRHNNSRAFQDMDGSLPIYNLEKRVVSSKEKVILPNGSQFFHQIAER